MRNAPRTGIATVCLSGTLEDKLAAAAAAGFDGVEIFENDLIVSASSPEDIRERCADLGLRIDLYQPFRDFEAVPPETLRANLRRAGRKFELMRRLGAELMLVCSNVSPETIDDDALAAEQLHALASLAAEHGIRIAYEALAWARFVNTYQHSWRIVRTAEHPALGVCLDSFHVLSRGSDPAGFLDIPEEKLFFLQLADAPKIDMDVVQWSRHYRLFPGQGAFDLPAFVRHAIAAGYDGPLSLEVFNDVFRQADPRPAAVDAMRSLRALAERVSPECTSDPHLPESPDISGTAFTECTVDPESAAQMAGTLHALGFTAVGRHRSKPVQLWQQADARVLLNESTPDSGAAVGAIGLHTADPVHAARRAQTLLAPVLPRTREPEEADLASIAAPDGTQTIFCLRDDSGATGWQADFAPTSDGPRPSIGITGTDHVALTQPFDHFDEAAQFYKSVLGMEPAGSTEYAAPFGLVRSRAMTDHRHTVGVTLEAATLRRGEWAPAVPAPQHIAFSCDDALAAARAAHARAAPILPIPDNYYDDLEARVELPDELMTALREYSVLYDRDAAGEFLHFYTQIIGSRVFFEVVQRLGGYAGYGASNAPIRMAAHRRSRLSRDGKYAAKASGW